MFPRPVLVLVLVALCNPCLSANRPNILFVFSDDHAPHAIGAYNGWLSSVDPTPNLDRLAADGALFENCFCTNSICGPSRAVILTGKHSHLNGFRRNRDRFDGSQTTFPKLLRRAGYQTALIGKWHLASQPTGFDHWQVLPGQGAYYNPDLQTKEGRRRHEGHVSDVVTNLTIEWLREQRDAEKPFLLMCHHKAPHSSWMPAPRHLSLYADRDLPEPATLFDDWQDNASPARHQEMTVARDLTPHRHLKLPPQDAKSSAGGKPRQNREWRRMTPDQLAKWDAAYGPRNKAFYQANLTGDDLTRWRYQRYAKDYLRCVRGVDESVGTLRETLKELGLADNTIVVYASDQGFYIGDHGWVDKRWMYDESLRMPFIVHWPGVTTPGARVKPMTQNLDFAQTLLEAAGVDAPRDMQGRSLAPLLRGESPDDWRTSIYYHYYEYPSINMVAKHRGVRTERFKLIHFYEFDEWEFYDLDQDPDEVKNAYSDPRYSDQIARMKTELERLRQHYKDDSDVSPKPLKWREKFRGKRGRTLSGVDQGNSSISVVANLTSRANPLP